MRGGKAALAGFVSVLSVSAVIHAQRPPAPMVELTRPTPLDPDDIAGRVISAKGPEPGLWVVAETKDLPTRLIRIVATDEEGRYVLPDLPKARYEVFATGAGVHDSRRMRVWPGQELFIGVVTVESTRTSSTDADRAVALERNLVFSLWRTDQAIPPSSGMLPGDRPSAPLMFTKTVDTAGPAELKQAITALRLRVPYPSGNAGRDFQLRVDDVNGGWKSEGMWSTFTSSEAAGGSDQTRVLKIQLRPEPLAR